MKHIALLFISVLLLASCQKEDITPQVTEQPKNYFPYLNVGNKWVYDFTLNGQVYDSLVREIIGKENGIYEGLLKDGTMEVSEYFFVEGTQLMYFSDTSTKDEAAILSKVEISPGQKWFKVQHGDSVQVEVLAVDTLVASPAGNFNCNLLRETNLRSTEVMEIMSSPSFGMISMSFEYLGNPISYKLRYKNF